MWNLFVSMQSILYHNSSGNMSFTGNLKRKDVHNAITMHPVKNHINMYRIDTYLKNLKIQQLKEVQMSLHRDILAAAKELSASSTFISSYYIANSVPLYPYIRGHPSFLGDTSILGVAPSLNRYNPTELNNVLVWDHISKLIYSIDNANPRRRMEVSIIECLDDIIRELMEIINGYSKQRGRIIEFKEILYGYQRLDPIHGADYVLDILLVYKKYRGKKMTVPVRRHVYLQQSFTDINIREVPLGEPPQNKPTTDEPTQKLDYDMDHAYPLEDLGGSANSLPIINFKKFNVPIRGIMKLSENLPNIFRSHHDDDSLKKSSKKINFILPLSGRHDIFVRFMKNYESVCLISDKQTSIIITLYDDKKYPSDFEKTINLVNLYSRKYPYSEIKLVNISDSQFSRGLSLEKGIEKCKDDDLLFFIDVDIVFNAESLQRIRLNTVKQHTAYFPIVYSEYDPMVVNNIEYNTVKSKHFNQNSVVSSDYFDGKSYHDTNSVNHIDHENSDDYGYFRQFGFGIASVYKSDFVSVGGFNTEIKGWGLEDVHLFEKFVQSNISIFRAVDKGLVHVFHPVYCDKNLDVTQYQMCVGTRTNTFGSTKHMTIYIFNHQELLPKVKINSDSDKSKVVPSNR